MARKRKIKGLGGNHLVRKHKGRYYGLYGDDSGKQYVKVGKNFVRK